MSEITFKGMPVEDFYRVHGHLPPEAVEQVMVRLEETPDYDDIHDDVSGYIEEARHPFSAEDFLAEITTRVHDLAKRVRGDNRDEAKGIAAELEELQQTIFNAMEYADEQLFKAIERLGWKTPNPKKSKKQ